MISFTQEIELFLKEYSIGHKFTTIEGITFIQSLHNGVLICPIDKNWFEMDNPLHKGELMNRIRKEYSDVTIIYIYEDQWHFHKTLTRGRLLSHLGLQKSIFARNCIIKEISQEQAAAFLQKNHIYGGTKAKYRYGMFRKRATGGQETLMEQTPTLVAVATFSTPKKIDGFMSYQWERYASLCGTRIVGGMGKLLNYFVEKQLSLGQSVEIMSYADLEFSDGGVYRTLGFSEESFKPPVKFLVHKNNFKRIHSCKIGRDRAYSGDEIKELEDYYPIYNLGSIKFISRYK